MEINEAQLYPECQVLGEFKGGDYNPDTNEVMKLDIKNLARGCES